MQAFASPTNNWLPDLAVVANESEREQLRVSGLDFAVGARDKVDGTSEITLCLLDGRTVASEGLMLVRGLTEEGKGAGTGYVIRVGVIDRELLSFVDTCIAGVSDVVRRMSTLMRDSAQDLPYRRLP